MSKNKNDLLRTIQEKDEKIARVEKAFQNVMAAYRNVLAEKEALETSVKLLSSKSKSTQPTTQQSKENSESASANSDSASINNDETNNNDEKISALSANIQDLLETKSKLEANFQLERKKLKSDYKDLKTKYDSEIQESLRIREELELSIGLKQSELDKERLDKLNLEKEYKELVAILRKDNDELKAKIKQLSDKLSGPSDDAVKLERELSQLKEQYEKRIGEDGKQLSYYEAKLKDATEKSETRITSLESELAELYKLVANYENKKVQTSNESKQQHQQFQQHQTNIFNDDYHFQTSDDIEKAIQRIIELKKFVEENSKNINLDLNDLWPSVITKQAATIDYEKLHDKCKEEYKLLKDEYERYKMRTNQLMKAKYKELTPTNEANLQQLKEEIEFFKNRLNTIEAQKLSEQHKFEEKIENLETKIQNIKIDHKNEIEKIEQKYVFSLGDLEKQLSKQRERTLRLLSDKDGEIERLKMHINNENGVSAASAVAIGAASSSNYEMDISNQSPNRKQSATTTPNNEDMTLFRLPSMISPNSNLNETTLLHYSQEIALKDGEISRLRKLKHDMESRIKQIIDDHNQETDAYRKQVDLLKTEIERLKLNVTREETSANMEYIKNVVYRFLTAKEHSARLNMISAIMQILQFTKSEKAKVLSCNK